MEALKVKLDQKTNVLVFGIYKIGMQKNAGFTLIELLVVIAILGILASIAIPNFQRLRPGYERDQFIAGLNGLVQLAWQQALVTNTLQRITLDIGEKKAFIEHATKEKDQSGEPKFAPLTGLYSDTQIRLPQQIQIKQVFVDGTDLMAAFTTRKTAKLWFYIVPEGLTQEVTINALDIKDLYRNKPRQIGLVLNPFSAQFKVYDVFQKA